MFKLKKVVNNVLGKQPAPVLAWCLDIPSKRVPYKTTPRGLLLQGWLLLKSKYILESNICNIVVSWAAASELHIPLNQPRSDVIEHYSHLVDVKQNLCGFSATIPFNVKSFSIYVDVNQRRYCLAKVNTQFYSTDFQERALNVLEGEQGWLFLHNDTNQSVDQYQGKLLLSQVGLNKWKSFLCGMSRMQEIFSIKTLLVISPSKEAVLEAYYPYKETSGVTPIDQVLAIKSGAEIVYPVTGLKSLGDHSFIKTDTHWTPKGAREASVEVGQRLGFRKNDILKLFDNDIYKNSGIVGDLGSKLVPPQSSTLDVLVNFSHQKIKIYDNGLPNFGRLMVMEYSEPLSEKVCLIFGSSSSYFMLNYLTRFFSKTIFIHTAGNIDPLVVESVQADYVIAQTTGRFVIQAPTTEYCLLDMIKDKISRLTPEEYAKVEKRKICNEKSWLKLTSLHQWHVNE